MWLYDNQGRFFSAVQHRDDPELLVVRTRVRADAQHLADVVNEGIAQSERMILGRTESMEPAPEPVQVISYERSDYPWRVIMPRHLWAGFVYEVAMDVNYGNYKAHVQEVADHPDQRHAVLNEVWAANLSLEQIDRPAARWDEDWPDEVDPWGALERDPFGYQDGRPTYDWAIHPDGRIEAFTEEGARAAQAAAEADTWGQP